VCTGKKEEEEGYCEPTDKPPPLASSSSYPPVNRRKCNDAKKYMAKCFIRLLYLKLHPIKGSEIVGYTFLTFRPP